MVIFGDDLLSDEEDVELMEGKYISNVSCILTPYILSNLSYNWSNLLDMRNLQEQV